MKFGRREFIGLAVAGAVVSCRKSTNSGWGHQGLREGSFIRPRAMGYKNGEVYVIDTTGRIQVFSDKGEFLRSWSTPSAENGTPTAIAFTKDGRVIVPDTHYSTILEFTPEGKLLTKWGKYGTESDAFIYPTGLVCTDNGNYFFSEYGVDAERVHVFDANHQFVREWGVQGDGEGQFSRAMAIALGPEGELYIADTANHRVQCFDQQGKFLRAFGEAGTEPGKLKFPFDLTMAPDGSLLMAEYGTHRISRFKTDGTFVATYGKAGRGAGQFNGPRGVTVSPAGQVFVADTDNHRIVTFGMEALS